MCVDHSARSEFGQQRHQRQSDDGEMIALNALEQLDAEPLDLVGADDPAQLGRRHGQVAIEKCGLKERMVMRASPTWDQTTLPSWASTTAETRRCVRPRRRSSWPRAAVRSPGLSNKSSPRASTWSAPIIAAPGCPMLTASALARASASAISAGAGLGTLAAKTLFKAVSSTSSAGMTRKESPAASSILRR